jgi:prepilin signal peptidase PulO-like enzyme (type II secretory pathway)
VDALLGVSLTAGICGFSDWKTYRIPNWATFPSMGIGLLVGFFLGRGVVSLEGLAIGFLLGLPAYAMGLMGAGDVKLLMALGTWLGPVHLLPLALLGALIALAWWLILAGKRTGFRGAGRQLVQDGHWLLVGGFQFLLRGGRGAVSEEGQSVVVPYGASLALAWGLGWLPWQWLTGG